jgi:hypothetical protein
MNMNFSKLSGGCAQAEDVVDHEDCEDGESDYDCQVHEQRAFDAGGDQGGFWRFFVVAGLGFVGDHFFIASRR